jgi:hypothetical protein
LPLNPIITIPDSAVSLRGGSALTNDVVQQAVEFLRTKDNAIIEKLMDIISTENAAHHEREKRQQELEQARLENSQMLEQKRLEVQQQTLNTFQKLVDQYLPSGNQSRDYDSLPFERSVPARDTTGSQESHERHYITSPRFPRR